MGIGVSVALIALGLILALAVHVSVAGLDLQVVGWILVAAGALGLVMTFAVFGPRQRRSVRVVERTDPAAGYPVDPRLDPRYDPRVDPRNLPPTVRERTYDEGPL